MTRKIVALMLTVILLFSLAACKTDGGTDAPGSSPSGGSVEIPAGSRVYTDDCGREVEIPDEINAIVASGPLAHIVLFAIAPEMLVGLAMHWADNAKEIIAEEYLDLPYFGQLYGSADLNIEELALTSPQLIVDIGEPKGSVVEDMDSLEAQTNTPSVHIDATLETMPQTFRKLGELLGREEKGEELAGFCERIYSRTASIMEKVGDNKVNALYILGEEGLNVLAQGSYHAELMDMLTNNLAVVDNPAGKGTGNQVTIEQIAAWNPDFIVFSPESIYSTAAETDTWRELKAIAEGNYVEVPDCPHNWMGTPASVQRYLGLIWLTWVLYPQYCDYDPKDDIMEYYELFYGCSLTDEQYRGITANGFLNSPEK